jgi:endoglucanase
MVHGALCVALLLLFMTGDSRSADTTHSVYSHGGIVRMDTTRRTIYLIFTGHEFADGGESIRRSLHKQGVKATFFFTGDFYRNPSFGTAIAGLQADGHYLGPHSDKHLLYVSWENRDSLLVTREEFLRDLDDNYGAMESLGIHRKEPLYFMPAYEWYNDSIASWCNQNGVVLVNFTAGTSSNADYTYPELGARYVRSDTIMARILRVEQDSPGGLNGFLLLTHIGTDPARPDRFYHRLDSLVTLLRARGYTFRSLGTE